MRTLAATLLAFVLTFTAPAAEPWLKADDVVALVGGEDMVALNEEGWLETLVTWAQPKDRIRFRSLAWEGDTVFEQRRDLNYPALEAQLDKIGATVVICQFGKMESFAGKEGVAVFADAYGNLIARLRGESKRRVMLVLPPHFGAPQQRAAANTLPDLTSHNADLDAYREAIHMYGHNHPVDYLDSEASILPGAIPYPTRDGVHVTPEAQFHLALALPRFRSATIEDLATAASNRKTEQMEPLRTAIRAKNRMWFHYSRPQNWAFLAGNRTNQPSSRDHIDPTKRWFPEEMEQWLPLIEAKEKEIWAMAAAPR